MMKIILRQDDLIAKIQILFPIITTKFLDLFRLKSCVTIIQHTITIQDPNPSLTVTANSFLINVFRHYMQKTVQLKQMIFVKKMYKSYNNLWWPTDSMLTFQKCKFKFFIIPIKGSKRSNKSEKNNTIHHKKEVLGWQIDKFH